MHLVAWIALWLTHRLNLIGKHSAELRGGSEQPWSHIVYLTALRRIKTHANKTNHGVEFVEVVLDGRPGENQTTRRGNLGQRERSFDLRVLQAVSFITHHET